MCFYFFCYCLIYNDHYHLCVNVFLPLLLSISVLGTIDDFDPLRGLHHVNFRSSNAQGNWEGWFKLNGGNCHAICSTRRHPPTPAHPTKERSNRGREWWCRHEVVGGMQCTTMCRCRRLRDRRWPKRLKGKHGGWVVVRCQCENKSCRYPVVQLYRHSTGM